MRNGIGDQVRQQLIEASRVTHQRAIKPQSCFELSLGMRNPDLINHALETLPQIIGWAQLDGDAPTEAGSRKVHDAVDQLCHSVGTTIYGYEHRGDFFVVRLA